MAHWPIDSDGTIVPVVNLSQSHLDDEGNLKVTLGAGAVNVDLATVDVSALIAGIANGKTLADVDTALGTLPQDGAVSAVYKISVTSASTDLPTLIGATIPANLLAVGIFRSESSSEVIRHAFGTASASSPAWPEGAASAAMTKTLADTLQLYAATTTEATVWLVTPRG